MADLVTRLKLVNNEFNSGIDSSKKKVEELQETADDASKSIQDLGNRGSRSAKELLAEMAKTEQANRSTSNYNRQLRELQRTIADLTINYRAMSDEMKNSSLGQEVAAKIQELTLKASEYKDAIEDANASVKALASDTSSWDGMRQGIDAVSGALQGFAALGVLSADSTEKLVKVIAKLKAIEAATNAVIKIGNALQRNSALMMSVSKIQTLALAAAKRTETTATVGATIAQKAFNIVAKANPYVLLATAVIAVGSALLVFAKNSDKAREAEKKHQEQLEKEKEELEDWANTVGTSSGKALAQFYKLGNEYQSLTNRMDKANWIKANASAFKELGISINSLGDADTVFINNTDKFKEAIMERARAAAMYNIIVKNFEKYSKELEKLNKGEQPFKAGQIINEDQAKLMGHQQDYWTLGQSDRHMGKSYVTLSEAGAEVLNAEWREKKRKEMEKELNALNDDLEKEMADANAKFNAILEMYGVKANNGGDNGDKTDSAIAGSLRAAQEEAQRLQAILNNMNPDDVNFEKTKKDLAAAREEVERLQNLVNIQTLFAHGSLEEASHFVQFFSKELEQLDPNTDEFQETLDLLNAWKTKQKEINDIINKTNVDYVQGSLAEANAKVAELQEQLKNLNPDTEEFQKVLTLLNQWKQKQDDINEAINGTVDKVKTVADKYKDIVSQASDISLAVDIGEIDPSEGRRRIAELNKKLSEMGLTVKVDLEFDTKIEKFQEAMTSITDQISAPISAINNVKSAYQSMIDSFEDPEKDGWDQFFATFQFGTSVIEALNTVLTVLNTIQELVAASKAKSAAASIVDANAATADATAQSADAAATTTNAAVHGAAAAAKSGEAVASIPYVGPVLAIAAIAAVMAAIIGVIASAKGFATGGVIDATSKIGDKNIIRVNGGEMILNNRQQANLFKLLDEGRKDTSYNLGGDVEFKIQGTQLVGVLNNINRKYSKI